MSENVRTSLAWLQPTEVVFFVWGFSNLGPENAVSPNVLPKVGTWPTEKKNNCEKSAFIKLKTVIIKTVYLLIMKPPV